MWWINLPELARVFFIIAVTATAIMIVQIILMIAGIGSGGDFDADGDIPDIDVPDADFDIDPGLSLFTFRGIVSFLAIGGWVGFAFTGVVYDWLAILLAVVAGTITLFLMAFIMKKIYGMQSSGNLIMKNAIGSSAEVYLTIPDNGGSGKITLYLQERYIQAEAVTNCGKKIPTGTKVRITGINGNTYTVDPEVKPE